MAPEGLWIAEQKSDNAHLVDCDAGIHPGWAENKSPTHGYIFRIDLI